METYEDVREKLQPLDLILFSGRKIPSRLIQLGGWTKWSHIGVVVVLKEFGDTRMLLESTTLAKLPDILSGKVNRGVQMHRLSERLSTYPGSFAYRMVLGERTESVHENIVKFYEEFGNHPYEESYLELMRAQYDGPGGHNEEDLSSLFCSELVAELYQRTGVFTEDLPSNEYVPGNFARKMVVNQLTDEWTFGDATRFEFQAED